MGDGREPEKMVGIWIALEDADEALGNGPLQLVPGSHNLKSMNYYPTDVKNNSQQLYRRVAQAILKAKIPVVSVRARAGDVVIWHEKLFHGGSPMSHMHHTRLSIVLHANGAPSEAQLASTSL